MKKRTQIEIKVNHIDKCYDLIDVAYDTRDLVAKVYDRSYAAKIANLLTDNDSTFQCHNGED